MQDVIIPEMHNEVKHSFGPASFLSRLTTDAFGAILDMNYFPLCKAQYLHDRGIVEEEIVANQGDRGAGKPDGGTTGLSSSMISVLPWLGIRQCPARTEG